MDNAISLSNTYPLDSDLWPFIGWIALSNVWTAGSMVSTCCNMSGTTSSKAFRSRSWTSQSTEKERKDITNLSKSGTSLVSGCSRLGQTWTPPWAVTSPRETRRSRTFCNDEDDGAENVDQFRFLGSWPPSYRSLPNIRNWKMNWRPSIKVISRNLSNASDFSWNWIFLKRTLSRFKTRKERSSLYVHILQD